MTKEQIEKKALEAYPENYVPIYGDTNKEKRNCYIKALTEFFTPEMMWKIFQVGKEAVEELNGKETTTEYVGKLILKKLKI